MTSHEELQEAMNFQLGMRGQLILSQALTVAMRTLEKEPHPETSNIADMLYLRDTLYPMYPAIEEAGAPSRSVQRRMNIQLDESQDTCPNCSDDEDEVFVDLCEHPVSFHICRSGHKFGGDAEVCPACGSPPIDDSNGTQRR